MTALVSVYFLNVGQGASQIIRLSNQRVIIVDTGRKRTQNQSPLLSLLGKIEVKTIEALVLSHNDTDHIGEIENIFDRYKQKINKVYLLIDRSLEELEIIKLLRDAVKNGVINKDNIFRLEISDKSATAKDIFVEGKICVSLLYPYCSDNILSTEPNNTAAVISLTVGSRRVIFSSDAPIETWKRIVSLNGQIYSDILTVPHHSGRFVTKNEDFKWFFDNILCEYAVVSVGMNNRYGHPIRNILQYFTRNGTEVFCTQMNFQCYGQKVIKDTECGGTIAANIGTDSVSIKNIEQLRNKKEQWSLRLCKSE